MSEVHECYLGDMEHVEPELTKLCVMASERIPRTDMRAAVLINIKNILLWWTAVGSLLHGVHVAAATPRISLWQQVKFVEVALGRQVSSMCKLIRSVAANSRGDAGLDALITRLQSLETSIGKYVMKYNKLIKRAVRANATMRVAGHEATAEYESTLALILQASDLSKPF